MKRLAGSGVSPIFRNLIPRRWRGGDFDDSDAVAEGGRGPGESHYEWPGMDGSDADDSQVELPAFADDDSPSDEMPPLAADPSSDEILVAKPRQVNISDREARYPFAAGLMLLRASRFSRRTPELISVNNGRA